MSRESNTNDPSEQTANYPAVESPEQNPAPSDSSAGAPGPVSYSEFCLERLAGLIERRAQSFDGNQRERAYLQRLVDRALYSAYHDCVAAGAKDEADRLIKSVAEKS